MAPCRRLLPVLLALAAAACHESSTTPTPTETRPVLVLVYTGPCARRFLPVTIDGTAVGAVQVPGSLAWPLAAGSHRLQVGTSPEFSVEMPADRDVTLTNDPSPCP